MPKTSPLKKVYQEEGVKDALKSFQKAYALRDLNAIEGFLKELFIPEDDLLIITTGNEWCKGLQTAREAFEWDWEYWGDLFLDLDNAIIHTTSETAWVACHGTISKIMEPDFLKRKVLQEIQRTVNDPDQMPGQKLFGILQNASHTLSEIEKGRNFVWPLRFTAVLVNRQGNWLFHQIQFSFPTTQLPDLRA